MKAVLVIDMLEDFFHDDPLKARRASLSSAINRLTGRARAGGSPIIWVRQEFKPDLGDAFPVMREKGIRKTIAGTRGCRLLDELEQDRTDHDIVKKRYSAFFRTGLDDLLAELNVDTLFVAGVNTHACVRAAAIDAYQRDLAVIIPRQCVASYDDAHHRMTLEYLGKHIARVVELEEALRGL